MSHAIIKSGAHQHLVNKGDIIAVDKLTVARGKKVTFKEVLLVGNDKKVTVGTPTVSGASVEGKVILHDRTRKVIGVKMKAKKRYRRRFGHRQAYTKVEITKISSSQTI